MIAPAMDHLGAVDRDTIRSRAESALRTAIVEGRFAPGERLIERALCEALQVSRASLREAMRSLAAEGLVQTVPHRGPVVARIDIHQAREIYAVREMLEGLAARTVAERRALGDPAADVAVSAMTSALDRMRTARRKKAGAAELAALKVDFYRALFDGAGNRTLAEIMGQLLARIGMLRRMSFTRADRLRASLDELQRIVAAIAAGDADAAEAVSRQHVRQASQAATALLEPAAPPSRTRTRTGAPRPARHPRSSSTPSTSSTSSTPSTSSAPSTRAAATSLPTPRNKEHA